MADPKTGLGVDASGGPVIDPTQNVRELVDASIKRLDDLRAAADLLADTRFRHLEAVAELRAAHARELNEAETKRIDAIRAVDVAAVAIATERAAAAATVLANQVSTSAETLRALVATTATASTAQSSASFSQLADRISLLERSSYEGSGKSSVADPQMVRMVETMERLSANMAAGAGVQANRVERRADYGLYIALVVAVLASGLLPRLLGQ